MNTKGAKPVPQQAKSHAESYVHLIERYLNVMIAMVTVGILVIVGRVIQMGGWDVIHTTQVSLATLLWIVLVFRKRIPPLFVIGNIYFSIFAFVLMGAFRFGLLEPALYLFVGLPVASAVIWGLWPGLITLAIVMVALIGLAAKFLYIAPGVPFDAHAYILDDANWIIFLVSVSVNALWCILLVNLQRNFWLSSNQELHREIELRTESERQRNEASFRWDSIAENISGVLFDFVRLPDGTPMFENVSSGSIELLGLTPKEIHDDADRVFNKISEEDQQRILDSLDESQFQMNALNVRFDASNHQGEKITLQMTGRPVAEQAGQMRWHCVVLDVTREVEAEAEAARQAELAQQAQRQKSIGQLTGGIAHDFNNLLAVIVGTLELIREDENTEEWHDLVDNAMKATHQGIDLTRNMLSFSRQAPLKPKVLDINDVVATTNSWFRRTLPANIAVDLRFEQALWPVRIDESSAVNALLNLVVNARDAMPEGGSISISTRNFEIEDGSEEAAPSGLRPGRYVAVSVKDNGSGMPEDVVSQIFEPFFTTKDVGAGTGLGLPMVHGFVTQSGGSIRVHSEEGVGTEFCLYFPACDNAEIATSNDEKPRPPLNVSKGRRLLVVEDEALILRNLKTALTRIGYNVVTAKSGDEAAELLKTDSDFDLMLTDIVMPGRIQGTHLVDLARVKKPDLPVVLMSGYSAEFANLAQNGTNSTPLLLKPVSRAELIKTIEEQLGQ